MDFKSADSSVIKSIRQRDLLTAWLRLYVIASQERISEDGDSAIRNLIRANDAPLKPVLLAVIDRNFFHSLPARGGAGGAMQIDWD